MSKPHIIYSYFLAVAWNIMELLAAEAFCGSNMVYSGLYVVYLVQAGKRKV